MDAGEKQPNSTPNNEATEPTPPIINRMTAGWDGLSSTKKVGLGAFVTALMVALLWTTTIQQQEDYALLYEGLDYKTAGSIKQALVENGVTNYKIGDDGTSIWVPRSDVNSIRMDLAVGGYEPQKGIGFEILDNIEFGTTEDERQMLYQRALEGELASSIVSLASVEEARVHLNLSESSIFVTDTEPASASVLVTVKAGADLSVEQIDGIVALVAGAVTNLAEENIEVIDQNGARLTGSENVFGSGELVKKEAEYEQYLEDKVTSQLGKVLGYKNIAVAIRVSVNQTSEEERHENYEQGPILSEETTFTKEDGASEDTTDSPVDNNVSNEALDPETGELNPEVTDYHNVTNYQNSATETHTVKPPGEITRITASVIFSGELTKPLQQELTQQVTAMLGLNDERGDSLSISGIPFNTVSTETTQPEEPETSLNIGILEGFLIATLVLTVLAFIAFLFLRKGKKTTEVERDEFDLPLNAMLQPNDAVDAETYAYEEDELTDSLKLIKRYVEENPEETMTLLRVWLNETPLDRSRQTLVGAEKVAQFLVLMGTERAGQVMAHAAQEEVLGLVNLLSSIDMVPLSNVALLCEDFLEMMEQRDLVAQGGYNFTRESLKDVLGEERTESLLARLSGDQTSRRPFHMLRHMESSELHHTLLNEHPQTVALVLSYLAADKAAEVLAKLSPEQQLDVVSRIGSMSDTSYHVVEEIEAILESRAQTLMTSDLTKVGGIATVIDLMNAVDRRTQVEILDRLNETNPDLADTIRSGLFTFDDLVLVDNLGIQRMVRDIEGTVLATALRGASDIIVELIKRNMSERAVERLDEDMKYLGPVRIADVERAQQEIIALISQLEEAGELIINRGGDDDVLY